MEAVRNCYVMFYNIYHLNELLRSTGKCTVQLIQNDNMWTGGHVVAYPIMFDRK